MRITFLGQAGFLINSNDKFILIDPYLSNNVAKFEPKNVRKKPIDEKYLKIVPDYILISHCHLDHYDKETLKYYLNEHSEVTVICPSSVYDDIQKFGRHNKYILLAPNKTFEDNIFKVLGVKAKHSDPAAIGFLLTIENKKLYFTGDTLFDPTIFDTSEIYDVDLLAIPINGVGNNMNVYEAIAFSNHIRAKVAIPIHYGMFDDIDPIEFQYQHKLILNIYRSIIL